MPENEVGHLLPVQNEVGETPIWVSKGQELYTDLPGRNAVQVDNSLEDYQ